VKTIKNKTSFFIVGFFCIFFNSHFSYSCTTSNSAPTLDNSVNLQADQALEEKGLQSWGGLSLIDLGAHFISEVSKRSESWSKKDSDSFLVKYATNQDLISKTIVNGFVNTGRMLILIGVSKEYETMSSRREKYQQVRLAEIKARLVTVQEAMKQRGLDQSWMVEFFEKDGNSVTRQSLGMGVSAFGNILKNLHVYGVGVELVSDFPVGSLATFAFKNELIQSIGDAASYQSMKGILYFMKKNNDKNKVDEFVSTSFAQQGARVQGSFLTRGQDHRTSEFNFTVRLSLMTSSETLVKFSEENLNNASVTELNLRNDLSGTLPDRVQGLVKKTIEALDSSANFSFLRESTKVAFGFIHSTSSNDNVVDNTPNILLRFAIGDYSQGLSMRTAFRGWFEPSVSLGLLGVDKILK
jgi:hypothetical protein